jgi:hypothetical protein
VELVKVVPTWRNDRRERDRIYKRLDKFLSTKSLFNDNIKIKSRVGLGGALDHLPILIKLDVEEWKPTNPLKFNHAWLRGGESM